MDVFNLSTKAKSKAGARMVLVHPDTDDVLVHQTKGDNEPREMYLTLLGPEAPAVKRLLAKAQNRTNRRKKNHIPSDDEIEQDIVADSRALAEVTVDGLVFGGDQWIEVTAENAYQLYYDVDEFRAQALNFIFNRGNFTKG